MRCLQWVQIFDVAKDMLYAISYNPDDIMTCKCYLHYWPFVRENHQWLVVFPHKGPVMPKQTVKSSVIGDTTMLMWQQCDDWKLPCTQITSHISTPNSPTLCQLYLATVPKSGSIANYSTYAYHSDHWLMAAVVYNSPGQEKIKLLN